MQPFEDVRVLDFTHVLAGPFCTHQLAVMGADVVKIESPTRPDMMRPESVSDELADQQRGTRFLAQGANKRSLMIDFNCVEGAETVQRLAEQADVIVENFRAGVLARVGLDYKTLSARNPTLIYCSMTGFGQTGPKANHPAYDNVIQAYSGLMAHTGSAQSAPVRVGPPVLDYGTGAQAAFAISAALFQRSRTGKGQHIDVAMLDAALMLMSTSVVDTQVLANAPEPQGNSSPVNAGYACYETSEGKLMIGAFTTKQCADLWRALEREDIAVVVEQLDGKGLELRVAEHRELLANLLRARPASDWEDRLNFAGVPAARVRQLDETLQESQLASRKVLQQTIGHNAVTDSIKLPVAAFSYQHGGPQLKTHAPLPGQHSREVLQELGVTDALIDAMEQRGVISTAKEREVNKF